MVRGARTFLLAVAFRDFETPHSWCNGELVLKKSPSWCLRGRQQQGYKQTRVSDAAGNRHSRRLAAYDGATRPFGVAVLLRIEDQVPQNHLLRFIDRYVSFDFVREKLRASYSETGRPSIDPEVLLRILLL